LSAGVVHAQEREDDEASMGEARVGLFVNPPGAEIFIDGEPLAKGQYVGTLDAGVRIVRFERLGYRTVQERLVLRAGEGPTYLVVHMRPSNESEMANLGRRGGWVEQIDRPLWAWTLTGSGGLLLIGGAVLLGLDGEPSCEGPNCTDTFDTLAGGAVLTTIGAVTLSAGVVLFLWDELAGRPVKSPATESTRDWQLGVGPQTSPQGDMSGASLWLQGRF